MISSEYLLHLVILGISSGFFLILRFILLSFSHNYFSLLEDSQATVVESHMKQNFFPPRVVLLLQCSGETPLRKWLLVVEVMCMCTHGCQAGLLGAVRALLSILINILSPSHLPGLSQNIVILCNKGFFTSRFLMCTDQFLFDTMAGQVWSVICSVSCRNRQFTEGNIRGYYFYTFFL